jgi:SSS family solute:Na+ symporter
MVVKISVLVSYFLLVLLIGFIARTRWKATPDSYFLANRKLGTVVLLGTMVATNFSAFTVFGTSGAGYRDGYAFFPIMGFGTGFMALSFWVLGRKIWRVGRDQGLVTPPELVASIYRTKTVASLFALVMIVFTVPYLALQPMAAGYVLEELVGLPYAWGCVLVTAIILLYTLRGGLRAVAWTDLFQGTVMLILLVATVVIVANHHGGFVQANQSVLASQPDLFARPGAQGKYTPGIWFSYILLWFLCDPMFPQLFQRFYTARNERIIGRIMLLYPLVCTVVFILPVSVGVMGHLTCPDLVGKAADRILPIVMTRISGDFMAALVMAAGLAALMSTMDSQLLTLSSIFTRDIVPLFRKKAAGNSIIGRGFVICLGLAGLALALKPPATILQIATQTFTGLAVLFPTVLFGLYLKRVYAAAAISSILCGEATLLCFYFKWLSPGPVLSVVWVMLVVLSVYLGVHCLLAKRDGDLGILRPQWLTNRYVIGFIVLLLLGIDVWAWEASRPLWLGLPWWVAYFAALSALQTFIMGRMIRSEYERKHHPAIK